MKRRSVLVVVLIIAVASLFLIPLLFNPSQRTSGTIRVGAVLPLSGNVSVFGEWMRNGMSLRLEQLGESDGDLRKKLRIYYRDSQNDASTGLSAFRQLISVQEIDIGIAAMSRVALPIIPVAIDNDIPLLLQDVTYPDVTARSSLIYRHFIQSDREARLLSQFALDGLSVDRFAIIHVNDEAGVAAANAFERIIKDNASVVARESYPSNETEFNTVVNRVLTNNPGAIFHFGNGPSWARAMRALEQSTFDGTLLTNTAMYIPPFRELAGPEAIEGAYFTFPPIDTTAPAAKTLIAAYRESGNGESLPPLETAYGYDLVQIMVEAISVAGDTLAFSKALNRMTEFNSVFGQSVQINATGEVLTPIAVAQIQDGSIRVMETEEP